MNNSFTTSLVFLGVDGNALFVTAVALDCLGLKGMFITVGSIIFSDYQHFLCRSLSRSFPFVSWSIVSFSVAIFNLSFHCQLF